MTRAAVAGRPRTCAHVLDPAVTRRPGLPNHADAELTQMMSGGTLYPPTTMNQEGTNEGR
jgi:hypothetical protein